MHILAYKALLFLVSFSIPPPRPGLDQVDRSNRNLLQACDGQGCAWVYARARLWVREAHNPCVRVGEGESTEKQYIPPFCPGRKWEPRGPQHHGMARYLRRLVSRDVALELSADGRTAARPRKRKRNKRRKNPATEYRKKPHTTSTVLDPCLGSRRR